MDEAVPPLPDEAEQTPAKGKKNDQNHFPCKNCAGPLVFVPGSTKLKCPYCGTENEIPLQAKLEDNSHLAENDYLAALERENKAQEDATDAPPADAVRCTKCGAVTTINAERTSDTCPYCGSPLAMQNHFSFKLNVQAVLPFAIAAEKALTAYRDWIRSRWFAPSDFKNRATRAESMKGVYMPYWTYDSNTVTWYTGERGDAYYVTEMVQVQRNGKSVLEPRKVRKIRWSSVNGVVYVAFDDILIPASKSLPQSLQDGLAPWQLQNLQPFRQEFLSGFVTESYQVGLKEGFDEAKTRMVPTIESAIKRDIGGDEQRIHSYKSQYNDITFKHILLPVWLSSYAYDGRTFRFMLNAQTGEVSGERPWSIWKIMGAIIAGIGAIALLVHMLS